MLNQVVLVGRMVDKIEVEKTKNDKPVSNLTLAVPRSFKNTDGEYETDFIDIKLFGALAENTSEYCGKGDIVGVKGRIEGKSGKMIVIAEKVTFLSSKKEEEK